MWPSRSVDMPTDSGEATGNPCACKTTAENSVATAKPRTARRFGFKVFLPFRCVMPQVPAAISADVSRARHALKEPARRNASGFKCTGRNRTPGRADIGASFGLLQADLRPEIFNSPSAAPELSRKGIGM